MPVLTNVPRGREGIPAGVTLVFFGFSPPRHLLRSSGPFPARMAMQDFVIGLSAILIFVSVNAGGFLLF